jgi:uncharacterized protein YukJ
MLISISYKVPVQVIVDPDSRQVHRVVVIDEEVSQERGESAFYEDFDTSKPITDLALIDTAYQVAEEAEWPGWEHGF